MYAKDNAASSQSTSSGTSHGLGHFTRADVLAGTLGFYKLPDDSDAQDHIDDVVPSVVSSAFVADQSESGSSP